MIAGWFVPIHMLHAEKESAGMSYSICVNEMYAKHFT